MQKIRNVNNWVRLGPGEALPFPVERPRSVTIEVNAAHRTRIDLIDADGEIVFLALVEARDRIEFEVEGAFQLTVDQDDTFIYSDDSQTVHRVCEAPESYTRIMQGRRQRNPELEFLAKQMSKNFERQLAKQATAYEHIMERSFAARTAQPAADGAAAGAASKPAPNGDGEPSAEPAAGAGDAGKGKA